MWLVISFPWAPPTGCYANSALCIAVPSSCAQPRSHAAGTVMRLSGRVISAAASAGWKMLRTDVADLCRRVHGAHDPSRRPPARLCPAEEPIVVQVMKHLR